MKKFLFLVLMSVNANAASELYSGVCRNTHPLTTYESCNMHSSSGYGAYLCALNEAVIKCKVKENIDCVEVGTTFEQKVSTEFVGYKACEVKVMVRGWKK